MRQPMKGSVAVGVDGSPPSLALRHLLGSVGANLIHHAHCPVVVVHPRAS